MNHALKSTHPAPAVLLYVPNAAIAARLDRILTDGGYSVMVAHDGHEFTSAIEHYVFDAVVTNTLHIRETRARVVQPIINYEVFVHDQPASPASGRAGFDVARFVERVRQHTRNNLERRL